MIIIMLGAPGAGKGTLSGILEKKLEIKHIATGDVFRQNIKEKTELGKLAEKYMSEGKLVPDDVTIRMITGILNEDILKKGVILDGFPRTVKQAEALDEILGQKGQNVDKVLILETPDEELIQRIVNRRVCPNPNCGEIFNMQLRPPKKENICDKCGTELVRRKDDTEEIIKERLDTYHKETDPLVDYYEKQGKIQKELVSIKINVLAKDVANKVAEEWKNI